MSHQTSKMCDKKHLIANSINPTDEPLLEIYDESPIIRCWDRIQTRHVITFWGFIGFTVVYALRVNLNMAIVAMVNNSALIQENRNVTYKCYFNGSQKTQKIEDGPFPWNQQIQGMILGSFYFGYMTLQLPAGWFAVKFGGKWLFGFGVLWTSVLTFFTPLAAHLGYGFLIVLRVLEGAGESVTYPAVSAMLGYWAPVMELSSTSAIIFSGTIAGLIFGTLGSGILIESNILGGWPSVFYLYGLLGVVWFLIWSIVAASTPAHHPRISFREKLYIESSTKLSGEKKNRQVPWKYILLSKEVWALAIANFANSWTFYTFLTAQPQYFEYVMGFTITQNGALNSLPYILSAVTYIMFGFMADILRSRHILGITAIRKVFTSFAFFGSASFIIGINFLGCNRLLVVVFLCLAAVTGSSTAGGYNVNHIDLAPQFAGVLFAITNMAGTVSGILGPLVIGQLTNYNESQDRWHYVFYISAVIPVLGAIIYLLFGSGKKQPWAEEVPRSDVSED